jgi:hypothetical protein
VLEAGLAADEAAGLVALVDDGAGAEEHPNKKLERTITDANTIETRIRDSLLTLIRSSKYILLY